jgi:NAD(P)-dependent dehydrogenase (short-subunit alcohol dehydrogenase family)
MSGELDGARAFITGGGSGIGWARLCRPLSVRWRAR